MWLTQGTQGFKTRKDARTAAKQMREMRALRIENKNIQWRITNIRNASDAYGRAWVGTVQYSRVKE